MDNTIPKYVTALRQKMKHVIIIKKNIHISANTAN